MRFFSLTLTKSCLFAGFLVLLYTGITSAQDSPVTPKQDLVTDSENCLFCHRYPNMGRYDKSGNKRIYYVNEKLFASSVHGKLRCKSCHAGLDQIPHSNVKKVDCSISCHIKEPSTGKEFSHANMVDKFRETLARCMGCHTSSYWAERFYSHFTHRMRKRRSQTEIVTLCTSCHEDQEKMARHGLESIGTFKDTFHWTQVQYGVKDAPDCISCHIPVGYSAHDIRPRTDRISPINMDNRVKTCSNQGGVQSCHPGATTQFATGRVHAYGMKAQLLASQNQNNIVEDQNIALVIERAQKDLSNKELFHYKVLELVKLFYKILIALVIGSMLIHQGLDYMASRRELKSRQSDS
jgi:hypothetical protein